MSNSDSPNSIWKEIIVAVVAAVATVLVTKTCDRISPDENKVIISDTIRVVESHTPQNTNDSLLFIAINELNRTIRETVPRSNNVRIVWPESGMSNGHEKKDSHLENVVSTTTVPSSNSGKAVNKVEIQEYHNYVNRVVDKGGFYKKGYTISDGGVYYMLEKKPKADDKYLTFEIRLIQPADLLSHIYLNICNTNEKGEFYQYFGQTFEVRDGLNRIKIANNLRKGKNRIEIGVFKKSEEGKDFPTFYRNIFTLER